MDGLARLNPELCLVYIERGLRTWSTAKYNDPNPKMLFHSYQINLCSVYYKGPRNTFYAPKTLTKYRDWETDRKSTR